ncbi:glycerophosphodiester phosphodiesterase family protein [Micromonospora parathelypteridis]|uniref:Glycerophosphoryl diester phosphodiesterase n=1 Tax=Micromonospora parathelypteridis TaxID=1839617 RepID=A0A840VGP2_9ACTN|nr:glycerophosphodiester phosphodiesterase family protein [Micromonospora parathelypteridis]MBB5475963.1 glycerophosphoryl diester phosphodiesterase [Micromonospora parathelypteridis]
MASDDRWLRETPIAHRGLTGDDRPANSLAAFEAGADGGYACELDVQLTRAGELVVVHDHDLTELTGQSIRTAELTPADRQRLRLNGTDQHIPTLAEVLERVAGRVPLLIELKRPSLSLNFDLVDEVFRQTAGYPGRYAVESFDPLLVAALRVAVLRMPPDQRVPVGRICGLLRTAGPVTRMVGRSMVSNLVTRPDFLAYEVDGFPSGLTAWWRRRGVPVIAWPVTSPDREMFARQFADNIVFSGYRPSPGDDLAS